MKIKNLKFYVLLFLAVAFGMTACQDDFSEEDFLNALATQGETRAAADHQRRLDEIRLQAQLAASSDSALAILNRMLEEELIMLERELDSLDRERQLEQLRDAGLLLSWSVEIQENRKPLDSVTVTLTTSEAPGARQIVLITGTDGTITAQDIPVGRNLITLTKTGYFEANVAVEFAMANIQNIGSFDNPNYIIWRRHESTILPVFSNTSAETATINAEGWIETDLTNNTPEQIPDGTFFRVNMGPGLQQADLVYPDGGFGGDDDLLLETQRILTYSVAGGENVGVGTFSGGTASIVVPALSEGIEMELIYENISGTTTQAVMFDLVTGEPITPAYQDVPRVFGPDHCNNVADYQWVPGAMVTFDAAPSQGSGFAVDGFTARGRSLGSWTYDDADTGDPITGATNPFDQDEVRYRFQNFGSGMSAAPTATVSDPASGTTASMTAHMGGDGFGVNITNGGADYDNGETLTFDVYVVIGSDTFYIATFFYDVPDDGALPTGSIDFEDEGIDVFDGSDVGTLGVTHTANGFTNDASGLNEQWYSLQHSNGRVTSFFVEVSGGTPSTDAVASVTRSLWIDALSMNSGGSGYVSAFTITFGGAGTNPVLLVERFATDYSFTLNNDNTSPYMVLPDVGIFMEQFNGTIGEASNVSYQVLNGGVQTVDINNVLTIDGNGDIQFFDDAFTYWISTRSVDVPTAVVDDPESKTAMGYPIIGSDGTIEGFADNTPSAFPQTIAVAPQNPADWRGEGYTSQFGAQFDVTIAGASGSGADVLLTGFTKQANGEFVWDGNYTMTSGGSDFLQNLNYPFDNSATFSNGWRFFDGIGCDLPGSVEVFPGNTYEITVYYGSGSPPQIDTGT